MDKFTQRNLPSQARPLAGKGERPSLPGWRCQRPSKNDLASGHELVLLIALHQQRYAAAPDQLDGDRISRAHRLRALRASVEVEIEAVDVGGVGFDAQLV